ncbi:MAG: diguanylate cyclase (GGDEF)-like protein [Oleiphilaceae bacterium]
MTSSLFHKLKQGYRFKRLGNRLTFYFIAIGLLFTTATVSILLVKQYHEGYESLYAEANDTIKAVNQQLARSLWNVDQESTHILLEGVFRMPSIQGVQIVETLGNHFMYGEMTVQPSLSRPLIFNGQNMGRIEVTVKDDLITESVREQVMFIIVNSTLMIGLIAFIFSIIVKKSITRHLAHISRETSRPKQLTSEFYQPITLSRPDYNDEISDLVSALNRGRKQVAEFAEAKKTYESQLEYQANFDMLTNLPNRRHIEHHLNNEIVSQEYPTKSSKLAIFFIDLDGFKEVNDSLGHSMGDKILLESAIRLKALISGYDGYVARFGGDEFIASFRCQSREDAELVAEEIILAFKENFTLNDAQLQLGCSIGVVLYPEHGENTEDLIRRADTAMYKAKEAGRNTFAFFDQSMMHNIVLHNKIKSKLKDAIANNQLTLHYQPLINLKTMSVIGFEALLRWHDDELGNVRPDLFIPVAEKSGLIFDIDIWVFEHAIAEVQKWRDQYNEDYIVAINFSPTNFHHRSLKDWTHNHKVFKQTLNWVELEVTERMMLDDDPIVLRGIKDLLKSGLKFSIDDFGTGYSSLGYIKKFSHILSKIKIDRLFVSEIMHSPSDQALVKSIITLADSLKIEVLAEGIETQDQESSLMGLGCDYAQGFFYSKAIPVSEIPDFLAQWCQNKTLNSSSA